MGELEPTEGRASERVTAALRVLEAGARTGQLVHAERIAGRAGRTAAWPDWVPQELTAAFAAIGIGAPWAHQAAAADLAWRGSDVIIATGTASGKSLGYLAPALTAISAGGTVLYLSPTRALAADQLRLMRSLADGLGGSDRGIRSRPRPAVLDSDTPPAQRAWNRRHANYLLTTPDMLHYGLLPQHERWSGFWRRLRFVVVDECHGYRGVFGSHVAQVLRRLRRVAAHHQGAGQPGPVFVLASATIGDPGRCAELLTGRPAEVIADDGAPRGPLTFALWEPPLTSARGEAGAPVRRSATTEAAALLAELVRADVSALAFVRSRRGAEAAATAARARLADTDGLANRVAAYRSGYLAAERRELEAGLRSGSIKGLATTTALELGIDVTGLDAVLIAGWPGTTAALWQQAGRAGRAGREAMAVLIARDDPLDTYLVHHPRVLLDRPVEATVLDPANPYVLAPHLLTAAAELPLTPDDLGLFGPAADPVVADLQASGVLRDRGGRWHLVGHRRRPPAGLRGTSGRPVRIVERVTGRLVGTVDEPSAHVLAHAGAVYSHQGDSYLVESLDLEERVALVRHEDPGYLTWARQRTSITISDDQRQAECGRARFHLGLVRVTRQVIGYTMRAADTGRPRGERPLDLPERILHTRAVWWTISPELRGDLAADGIDLPGAAHAAEHASIGLLPLLAACDRWDVGGLSADVHPETGSLTVFVYDGHEGGAGFAERGFQTSATWLRATEMAITDCECGSGCPSCVQSPKCGNGNHPLSKAGALSLLRAVLGGNGPVAEPQPNEGDPRRGGERGSPYGPAPGGQSGSVT